MTEMTGEKPTFDITEDYVPCGDDVIDLSIKNAVHDYYGSLVNGDRPKYRAKNIQNKLNDVAWEWGKSQDPAMQARSKEYQTKRQIRALAKVVLSGDPSQSDSRHLPTIDPFWKEVDDKLRGEIDDFTRRQDGLIVPYHLEFGGDSDDEFVPMAEIRDFRIYGKFLIRNGWYLHSEYLAQYASVPLGD